jgi:glycosyltransferase involved in cell wall biosynthesis
MSSNLKKPFFTICTEVTNRERTIERAMQSISVQNFIDYEYVIVDNSSSDKSHEVISNFLKQNNVLRLKTTYIRLDKKLKDIASWNKPLEFAHGRYVVVCEGDDWFEPNHLSLAYDILSSNNNIGMYISFRADRADLISTDYKGYLTSSIILDKLTSFDFVPPPSNVIFKKELNGVPFNYDSDNYVYAGEYSLYYDLLIQKLDVYVNFNAFTVNRGISTYRKGFFHTKDRYFSFNKWLKNGHYPNNELQIRMKLYKSTLQRLFFPQLISFTFEKDMIAHLLNEARKIGIIQSFTIFALSLFLFAVATLTLMSKKIVKRLLPNKIVIFLSRKRFSK